MLTHHITDEQIAKLHDSMFPAPYDGHANVIRFARAVLALAAPAPQGEPYGWAVTGCHSLYRGEWAESTAKAEARRCGGTARAFPLYTAPAPAVPMSEVDLQDDDALRFAQRVLESDAPESDRKAARDMLVAIRTRVLKARAALTPSQEAAVPSNRWLTAAVDAAMVEMKNISPPMRRSECERLICAALTAAPTPPAQSEPDQFVDANKMVAPVALSSVRLTRDTAGMCIVSVNGRVAIRDNGDIIDHIATLEWFAASQQPAVPEDVARVNKQMLKALEEVEEHLPFAWAFEHDPKLIGEEGYKAASAKVRAAIDAARTQEGASHG